MEKGGERERERERERESLNLVKSVVYNPNALVRINNLVVFHFVSGLDDIIHIKFHLACSKAWVS